MDAKKKVVIGLTALGAVAMLPGAAVGQQQAPKNVLLQASQANGRLMTGGSQGLAPTARSIATTSAMMRRAGQVTWKKLPRTFSRW